MDLAGEEDLLPIRIVHGLDRLVHALGRICYKSKYTCHDY